MRVPAKPELVEGSPCQRAYGNSILYTMAHLRLTTFELFIRARVGLDLDVARLGCVRPKTFRRSPSPFDPASKALGMHYASTRIGPALSPAKHNANDTSFIPMVAQPFPTTYKDLVALHHP